MRLVAFAAAGAGSERRIGRLDGEVIADLTGALGSDLGAVLDPDRLSEAAGPLIDAGSVRLLAPLPRPGTIICVGLNYRDHCREQGIEPPSYPMLFSKFANALADPGQAVVRPRATERLDLECELAAVIGREAKSIAATEALEHVFGYTVLNDVTMRDLQREDGQWLRAKGSDGFGPDGAGAGHARGDPGSAAAVDAIERER